MTNIKNRIVLVGSGWSLDGHAVREGDRVEVLVNASWRPALIWFQAGEPLVVQRVGTAGADHAVGVRAADMAVRWPGGVPPLRVLPN